MGDTGSELVGLLLLIFLAFSIIGVVGFKFIGWLEANQIKKKPEIVNEKSKVNVFIIGVFLIIILMVSAILVIVLKPNSPAYNTGQQVRIGDWVIEVTRFDQPGLFLQSATEKQNEIKAQGSWLEVEVSIENVGLGPLVPKLVDFEVDDSQNNAFLPDQTASASAYASMKSSLNITGGISPGTMANLWLVYDLPPNSSGLELVFKQGSRPHFRLTAGTAR